MENIFHNIPPTYIIVIGRNKIQQAAPSCSIKILLLNGINSLPHSSAQIFLAVQIDNVSLCIITLSRIRHISGQIGRIAPSAKWLPRVNAVGSILVDRYLPPRFYLTSSTSILWNFLTVAKHFLDHKENNRSPPHFFKLPLDKDNKLLKNSN